jgi:hypothetical protein
MNDPVSAIDVRLNRVARSIPLPDPAVFAAGVAERLRSEQRSGVESVASTPNRSRVGPRRFGAIAAGLAAVALAVVAAVAPARSVVADFLGVGGVHIRITRAAPPTVAPPASAAPSTAPSSEAPSTTVAVDPIAALDLGRQTTLLAASRMVGFPMRLPTVGAYQQPDAVYVGRPPVGGMASMVYLPKLGRPAVATSGVAALLTEFRGRLDSGFFQKLAGAGTTVEAVRVGSGAGYWLSGTPHEFFYVDPDGTIDAETIRLAADTLVWAAGGITYRFESALSRDAAITVATSMR